MKTFYTFQADVWLYPGMAGWHFLTLPQKESAEIKKNFSVLKRNWGSLPVIVTIGKTSWETSIFPDRKAEAYLLPLKAAVRNKEKIKANDRIQFTIKIKV